MGALNVRIGPKTLIYVTNEHIVTDVYNVLHILDMLHYRQNVFWFRDNNDFFDVSAF